jgi:hypothetical protein
MAEDKRRSETKEQRPEPDQARRAALAKMGRFAGYTAPVMLGRSARSRRVDDTGKSGKTQHG